MATEARSKIARVLVVGASGQLARSLLAAAPRHPGFDVTVLGRPSLDLLDAVSTARALDAAEPDWVINAAAYTAVDRAESEPDIAFAVNRDGARIVADEAARLGAPVIHVSTDYVFDGRKQGAYVESDTVNPLGVYGRSKLEGEQQVAAANSRHLTLRTSWVYSAYGSNFVKTMLRLASERPELRVVADQHGKPTHAGDLAAGIFDLIERSVSAAAGEAAWGTYHMAGQGATTWHGFAEGIVAASRKHGGPAVPVKAIATVDFPTPAKRPANSVLDCSKLEAAFGVRLPPWAESLDRCVAELAEGS